MIEVSVKLISAVTGQTTELARMQIANDGTGDAGWGNYEGQVFRGRSSQDLDKRSVQRTGKVIRFPRQSKHVWNLVARMLRQMGYS